MNNIVQIVISDRGWILERLATEITTRLPYTRLMEQATRHALITYYVTYSCWNTKVSPIEVAYFAHMEPDTATKNKFFSVATQVDHCVCHAELYNQVLQKEGINNVTTINPGVDLDTFIPKLRIGIVGRTYHTGRKGESIVEQLLDIDWIEWFFTGDGWHGPALNLPYNKMPDFYNSVDYILVPALYEGGPMCVAEALACGKEVIAPPIGWVPQFPHIEYKTGDVNDLRSVLTQLYQKKCVLRANVEQTTWDAWAEGHDRLFNELAKKKGKKLQSTGLMGYQDNSVAMILHGSENRSKGGPTTRVLQTSTFLNCKGGYKSAIYYLNQMDDAKCDLYHVFNVWQPKTCRSAINAGYFAEKPVVFSPIFLDLSEKSLFESIKTIFSDYYSDSSLLYSLGILRKEREAQISAGEVYIEPYSGYFDAIREIVSLADCTIFLSQLEKELFRKINIPTHNAAIIHNPVDTEYFSKATPEIFFEKYGIKDYVLCVGRIETRKNQLMLAYALKDINIPLVFIGDEVDVEYANLIRNFSNGHTHFLGRIPPNSPLLASAYSGAKVFCLPSWTEGAPLSALEAGASGCNMVLSNRSSEQEYFQNFACYCDPSSIESIRESVINTYDRGIENLNKKDLQKYICSNFSYDLHVEKLRKVYNTVHRSKKNKQIDESLKNKKIYIDLTSSANRLGAPSGVPRVEFNYAKNMKEQYPDNVSLTLFNGANEVFLPVEYDQLCDGAYKEMQRLHDLQDIGYNNTSRRQYDIVDFEKDSILLIFGNAWISSIRYCEHLCNTVRACRLKLIIFIHDMMPIKFPYWFPEGASEKFSQSCLHIFNYTSLILTNSKNSLNDIIEFSNSNNISLPPIKIVRFGDDLLNKDTINSKCDLKSILQTLSRKPYVLCVSTLNFRKNHLSLYNVWRKMSIEFGKDN